MLKKIFLLILSCFLFLTITHATTAATQTAATELVQLLNNFHTIKASFEQFLIDKNGNKSGAITTGIMMIARPGKFRWETTQPSKQLIILNKDRSILYDADLAQVINRKISSHAEGNPAMLLSNTTTSLLQSFTIVKLRGTNTANKNSLWFQLTPNSQTHSCQWIKINFVNKELAAMVIADNLGQQSRINLKNVVLNSNISLAMFAFTPPPNTEIFNE